MQNDIIRTEPPTGYHSACGADPDEGSSPGPKVRTSTVTFMVLLTALAATNNAARHGEKVTEIRFSSTRSGQDLVIVCEDDGIGIPDEEKEAIFRPAYKRRHGHGLFLVAEILGITGISIRETGVFGEGARFEIRVPNGGWRDTDVPDSHHP